MKKILKEPKFKSNTDFIPDTKSKTKPKRILK